MSGASIAIACLLVGALAAPPQARAPKQAREPDRPELRVQMGHAGGTTFIYALDAAFSADGRLMVTGGTDATARLWDTASGLELRSFGKGGDIIGAVSLSPDARMLATTDFEGHVRLWNTATGAEFYRFRREIVDAEFAPSGELIVFDARGVAVFDPITKTVKRRMNAAVGPVVFPEGRIAALCEDGTVRAWDAKSGVETWRSSTALSVSEDSIVVLSPDSRMVAVANPDGSVALKSAETGAEVRRLAGHTSEVLGVSFSPDGQLLATFAEMNDTLIRIWDVASGQQLQQFGQDYVRVASVTFAPDSQSVVATFQGGDIRQWEARTGREVAEYEGRVDTAWPVAFSPDGKYLVAFGGQRASIWSMTTGGVVRTIRTWDPDTGSIVDGVPVLDANGRCAVDDPNGGAPVSWRPPEGSALERFVSERHPRDTVFSPDHTFVVTLTPESDTPDAREDAHLWTALDGRQIGQFEGASECMFSPDSRRLLVTRQSSLELVETSAPDRPRRLKSIPVDGTFAISPDGRRLARVFGDAMDLWNLDTGALVRRLAPKLVDPLSVAFSPDGSTVVVGAHEAARVWTTATGKVLWTLRGPERSATAHATFSPDGRFVVTGGAGPARFWSLKTGKMLCSLVSFRDGSWAVVDAEGRFDASTLDGLSGLHWVVPDDPYTPLPLEIFLREYYEPRLLPRLLAGDAFAPVRDLSSLNRLQPSVRIVSVRTDASSPDLVSVQVEVAEARRGERRSGVFDLRLFRDGRLVGYAPQGDGPVPLDAQTGSATLTFDRIRIPRTAGLENVEFSAHAFNVDRVKSATARMEYRVPEALTPVKGTAFVVSIGANTYDDPKLDLRYAVNDARLMQQVVVDDLRRSGVVDDVVPIALLSDSPTQYQATKPMIQAVFDALAGRTARADLLTSVANADRLRAVRPEDVVVISFAGHGYANKGGEFYLVPSDVGPDARERIARTGPARRIELSGQDGGHEILARCISSTELAVWLRDVDAGQMALIVDACQSGAFVGENFKPGPMGSRGLGQLAYDKGMRVLAATQADNVAIEHRSIGHGLVSYVLVEEGLAARRADRIPPDGQIMLTEWLQYAVDRLPSFFAEVVHRADTAESADAPRFLLHQGSSRPVQQPALFDFSRGRDVVILREK